MIVLDDLFDYRQYRNRFGVQLQTPNFDRLAARGTTFGNAFCSIAVCNASRSSVFSGLSPIRTQIHQAEPIQFFDTLTAEDTLMSRMQDAGYRVFGTGKVMHTSTRLSDRAAMGQIHDEFFQARGRLKLPAGRQASVQAQGVLSADDKHVAWAADKLRNWDGEGKPLFLSVGIIRPHAPFIAPQEYFDLYDRASIRKPALAENDLFDVSIFYRLFRLVAGYYNYLINNNLDKEFIHGYLASTSYADAKVGEILDAIDANPALADARIMLWSDNGYELGDKLTWNKFTLWESSANVPLIVVDPSLPTGRTISHSVSLLDVAPTVLEWAGQPIPEEFDGISLLKTAESRFELDRRSVLTTMLGSCSLRRRDMRLNLYPDGSIELYHMRRDPNQRTNLATRPQWQPVVESMKPRDRATRWNHGS
jgi:arylsulfatase A-like enzyme